MIWIVYLSPLFLLLFSSLSVSNSHHHRQASISSKTKKEKTHHTTLAGQLSAERHPFCQRKSKRGSRRKGRGEGRGERTNARTRKGTYSCTGTNTRATRVRIKWNLRQSYDLAVFGCFWLDDNLESLIVLHAHRRFSTSVKEASVIKRQ